MRLERKSSGFGNFIGFHGDVSAWRNPFDDLHKLHRISSGEVEMIGRLIASGPNMSSSCS